MANIDIKQSMDVASKVFQEPNLSYSFLEHIPIPRILVPRKPHGTGSPNTKWNKVNQYLSKL